MSEVYTKQVIICKIQRRGKGIDYSPIRAITEVLELDGTLIADSDPIGNLTPETVLDFLKYHYKDIPVVDHIEKIRQYFIEEWEEENTNENY